MHALLKRLLINGLLYRGLSMAKMDLKCTGHGGFRLQAISYSLSFLWVLMTKTKIGLIMRATQQDSEMARAFGVPVKMVYAWVFGLGAGLAAMGAVLIVPVQQAHYLMGGEPLLLSFIVVIIGGLGSLPGTVIAALLIGLSDGRHAAGCNGVGL